MKWAWLKNRGANGPGKQSVWTHSNMDERDFCTWFKATIFHVFPRFYNGIYHHSWWGGLRVLEIVQRDCRTWVPAWWQTSSSRLLRLPEKTMNLKKSERPPTFLDHLSFPHGEHVEVSHWFSWFSPYHTISPSQKHCFIDTNRCFFKQRGPRIFPAEIGSQGLCLPRPHKCPRPQIPGMLMDLMMVH